MNKCGGHQLVQTSLQNLSCPGQHRNAAPFSRQLIEDLEDDPIEDDDLIPDPKEFVHSAFTPDDTLADLGFTKGAPSEKYGGMTWRLDFDFPEPIKLLPSSVVDRVTTARLSVWYNLDTHPYFEPSARPGQVWVTVRFGNIRNGVLFGYKKYSLRKKLFAAKSDRQYVAGVRYVLADHKIEYEIGKLLAELVPVVRSVTSILSSGNFSSVYQIRSRLHARGFRSIENAKKIQADKF